MVGLKKGGVLFSAGLSFLALTVLNLATTSVYYEGCVHDSVIDSVYIKRMSIRQDFVGEDLRLLFTELSGLEVEVGDDFVLFGESIPNPQLSAYQGAIDRYINFSRLKSPDVVLDLDKLRNNLSLVVEPQDMEYIHDYSEVSTLIVRPSKLNFVGYNVSVDAVLNLSDCVSDVAEGNKSLLLDVDFGDGDCVKSFYVDPSKSSSVYLNNGSLRVDVVEGGVLRIIVDLPNVVNVTTRIYLTKSHSNLTYVYLPHNTLHWISQEYNMSGSARIRINDNG
ncbi:MAG: hypothetical protein B6U97_02115 [Candidatus Altiarchaeales archaeon ex4484_96]|nr:MAG: hypothetical protein B6U97_02115 [Candidatus Altiarchaeales archaeon ex4484_96]